MFKQRTVSMKYEEVSSRLRCVAMDAAVMKQHMAKAADCLETDTPP